MQRYTPRESGTTFCRSNTQTGIVSDEATMHDRGDARNGNFNQGNELLRNNSFDNKYSSVQQRNTTSDIALHHPRIQGPTNNVASANTSLSNSCIFKKTISFARTL
jgi:hypothetical protein